jgi:cob(I)alamin adenosyltransferase
MKVRFVQNNSEWLEKEIELSQSNHIQSSKRSAGRSMKLFNERSKLRRTKSLIYLNTVEELMYAIQVCLNISGKIDATATTKEVTQTTPT